MTSDGHGTWAAYQRGCREECCRSAARNYQKRRNYDAYRGQPRTVDATGAVRRFQALVAIGWTAEEIGFRLGHSRAWVQQAVTRGNPTIHRRTAEKIAAVYGVLAELNPPEHTHMQRVVASRNRNRAARLGYAPPSAWFGVDIDDPAAQPDPGWRERPRHHRPMEEALEDFDWLTSQGISAHEAAARVGVALATVDDYRRRAASRLLAADYERAERSAS